MLTVVTFHQALSPETRRQIGNITQSLDKIDAVPLWIDLLFRSARHFHPECRRVLLSDEETVFPALENVETIRVSDLPPNAPLWSRLRAERAFLEHQATENSPIAFLDFDVLFNTSLEAAFYSDSDGDWDIGLTHRFHPRLADMPINAGVVLVRGGRLPAARRFFDILLTEYEQRHKNDIWWGEQRALAAVVGPSAFGNPPPPIVEQNGVRIGFLPGDRFNYSPPRLADLMSVSEEVALLHFKNNRKALMPDFWEFRLRPTAENGARLTACAKTAGIS